MKLTLDKVRKLLWAACKDGFYYEGVLYEFEPEVSIKLLQDRDLLVATAKKIIEMKKNRPDSPTVLLLIDALEKVAAGWPVDETEVE